MMNGYGKSDNIIVPKKEPNETWRGEEALEGRVLAKGNPSKCTACRTQIRDTMPGALERIREAAMRRTGERFTALYHHVYAINHLREAFYGISRKASPGIDGRTWKEYEGDLEKNLEDLSARLKRGAYRARLVRRSHVPKAGGSSRPIGLPVLEDKLVQRTVVMVLQEIYEQDFLGFSYGFRPRRSPHGALDALYAGITRNRVNWVLDADISGYFDTLAHEWLIKFIEHRIADCRIVRLIRKWLKAGVLEDGKRICRKVGTVQGGSISPLLGNIYLHYVFDLWSNQWREKEAKGNMIIIRYADDIVMGFQYREEAEQMLIQLKERFERFGLQLNPHKTRLIEFGRFAAKDRAKRQAGKPETFDFLGFTHICGKTRKGKFTILRKTMRKRWQAKLKEVYCELRKRMHDLIPKQGAYLRTVLLGYLRYYAVPMNRPSVKAFSQAVQRLWWKILKRRSQKHNLSWGRMRRLIAKWIPPVRIYHPYPLARFGVIPKARAV